MTRAVFFDLDGTLFDRDAAVRSLTETQYVAFERELGGVLREVFVSRLLELDAHGLMRSIRSRSFALVARQSA